MKRGYMDWNKELLPAGVLENRRRVLMETAVKAGADAVVIYGDVYSADELSFYVNYAPYWCNSAAVITADEFYMVTGHNNRVNPWISTLTGLKEENLLAAGFKVPVKIAESLKDKFPLGGTIGIIGKYVMAEVIKELKNHGFHPVMLDSLVSGLLKNTDEAYKKTAAKAAAILKHAFIQGEAAYDRGGNSKTVAAEIEYDARKNGAMDIVLYAAYDGQEFGLPVMKEDLGGHWTLYGLMQYLGVWVSLAQPCGINYKQAEALLDRAAGWLIPGAETAGNMEGYEISVKRVTADAISNLNEEVKELCENQIVAVSAYCKSDGIYCEKMYCVTGKGAIAL